MEERSIEPQPFAVDIPVTDPASPRELAILILEEVSSDERSIKHSYQWLANGADVNFKDESGNSLLGHTVDRIRHETDDFTLLACELLDRGADPNAEFGKNKPILQMAIQKGSKRLTEALLQSGAYANVMVDVGTANRPRMLTALEQAIRCDNVSAYSSLLCHGAKNDAHDWSWTDLALASCYGKENITRFLLDNGVDMYAPVELEIDCMSTAMTVAIHFKKVGIVKLMLSNGFNVNVRDANQATPLHDSVQNFQSVFPIPVESDESRMSRKANRVKEINIFGLLISEGANLDLQDRQNNTALHVAIRELDFEIAKLLVNAGARIDIPNADNKTSFQLGHEATDQAFQACLAKAKKDSDGLQKRCRYIIRSALSNSNCLPVRLFSQKLTLLTYPQILKNYIQASNGITIQTVNRQVPMQAGASKIS